MSQENPEKVFSLHRYILSDGTPDYERMFSEGDSKFWIKRHLDAWLIKHLDNQPEIIREDKYINKHLQECVGCKEKMKSDRHEVQRSIPLNPE